MKNISFVIWVLGFSALIDMPNWIRLFKGMDRREMTPVEALFILVIWIGVAIAVYER